MLAIERARAAKRAGDRQVEALGEAGEGGARALGPSAAAQNGDRPLRAHSIVCNSAICVCPGQIGAASARGASLTAAISVSMSSGSAITTGPGLPCIATWNARWTTSGSASAVSIWVANLVVEANSAR